MIKQNISLKKYSHYLIGGEARFFGVAKNEKDVRQIVSFAKKERLPLFVMGGGTNLLISDQGFSGVVLKSEINFIKRRGLRVEVGSGVLVRDLLAFAAREGLSGLEWAGGLPGTIGGAIRGNAGCFGGEIKDNLLKVKSVKMKNLEKVLRNNSACKFKYRSSVFKTNPSEIIISATFQLEKGDSKEIRRKMKEKISFREKKHPMEHPSIGSIFKNVPVKDLPHNLKKRVGTHIKQDPFPVVPVAYLISELGLKGVSCGGAMISPKHANFIVNVLDASADHVESLIQLVKFSAKKKFKIDLEEEIQRV